MSCELSEMWMMEALDGALTASDRQRLRAHLGRCSRCQAEWETLNALERMLTNPPTAFPAPGFVQRVEARLDHFEAQRRTLIGGLILLGAAVALCLLAVPPLLNGRNPLQAYGAFLWRAYELLGYGMLLVYKLFSALWLTLDTLARSADLSLLNLLTFLVGTALAILAWRRALFSPGQTTPAVGNGR